MKILRKNGKIVEANFEDAEIDKQELGQMKLEQLIELVKRGVSK